MIQILTYLTLFQARYLCICTQCAIEVQKLSRI